MITRLAPTPSGHLHWGNLYNFAMTWARVQKAGGKLWLRIDDVDATRMRPEYVAEIFELLPWLGFQWQEGPTSAEEFSKKFSQSLRRDEYRAAVDRLKTYACNCSRQQIQERTGGSVQYDGYCRTRGLKFEAEVTTLRTELPGRADTIVWTKDDRPAYHVVSIVDDLRMGTTHLIRGEDLRESSQVQVALAELMGESRYSKIEHEFHPLILGAQGQKLSKSEGSDSIVGFRARADADAPEVWHRFAQIAELKPMRSLQDALMIF
ncbi:MAG: hypothetical protein JST80_13260 [Bdellovibrionales bacterium]|nr:hypothetical protein [Bdellovibrionales bacterium]